MNIDVTITDATMLAGGFSTVAITIQEIGVYEIVDVGFDTLYDALGHPDPISLDFLLIASVAYVVDKAVARRYATDAWTRELEVSVPVSDPGRWTAARHNLEMALCFLTGDEWTLTFRERVERLYTPQRRRARRLPPATTVSLFSGGLDSLIGTLDHLTRSDATMLLLGHHDAPGPSGDQGHLYRVVSSVPAYRGRTGLLRVRVRPLPPSAARPGQHVMLGRREHTLRSRSLVFLALGLYAARALGPDVPLLVSENGYIAVNIPLTPSRVGTCSTRTTHPHFLDLLRLAVAAVGMGNDISNPLEWKTKGETITTCADLATLHRAVPETVSCAHASRRATWLRRDARNCGYCVPCIIRRSALYQAGWDDGQQYGRDICRGEIDLDASIASDIRAMLDCLSEVRDHDAVEDRVLATGAVLPHALGTYTEMVARGLEELRTFVWGAGNEDLRRRGGMS